jgi:hypothetical protein
VQVPVLSQAVAPHVPPVVQAAVQQLPVPVVPQTVDVHWAFAVHAVPAVSFATQAPLALQKSDDDRQSVSTVHDALQVVALAQMKPPVQGPAVPAVHVPVAHELAGVSMPALQEAPVVQAVLQHTSLTQNVLVHWLAMVHVAPRAPPSGIVEESGFDESVEDESVMPESVVDESAIIEESPPVDESPPVSAMALSPVGLSFSGASVVASVPPSCGIRLRSKLTRSSQPPTISVLQASTAVIRPHWIVRFVFITLLLSLLSLEES